MFTQITQATPKGALFHHYDWTFHKMIGRLRRLDGTYKVPDGKKAIDPMAADNVSKFYIAGSRLSTEIVRLSRMWVSRS